MKELEKKYARFIVLNIPKRLFKKFVEDYKFSSNGDDRNVIYYNKKDSYRQYTHSDISYYNNNKIKYKNYKIISFNYIYELW